MGDPGISKFGAGLLTPPLLRPKVAAAIKHRRRWQTEEETFGPAIGGVRRPAPNRVERINGGFPIDTAAYRETIALQGFAVFPDVLPKADVDEIAAAIEAIPPSDAVRQKTSVYGVRNLLETSPAICGLATQPEVWRFVTPILGDSAFACRAIFFNKTPDANWVLGWHQDSVISVAEKTETPGFIAWGQKAGVWQVQPPPEILASMLALRIHLDDCGPDNGPLRVLPGSHRHGWVEDDIERWKRVSKEVVCTVPRGGVVAMCPLILHASSKAISPSNRRVIHIEYAAQDLPNGLQWNRQVRPETTAISERGASAP